MDFYDSTMPHLMPAQSHALLYADGRYAVAPSDPVVKRFAAVRWITVIGNWRDAGAADFERGNEIYSDPNALRQWVQGRASIGTRARVYHDRADTGLVLARLFGLEAHYEHWVATLDGNKLSAGYLPNMWGVQYADFVDAGYDTSVLYGAW
jgi:hypothetical protein